MGREEDAKQAARDAAADAAELRQQLREAREALRQEKAFRASEAERYVATEASLRELVSQGGARGSHTPTPARPHPPPFFSSATAHAPPPLLSTRLQLIAGSSKQACTRLSLHPTAPVAVFLCSCCCTWGLGASS